MTSLTTDEWVRFGRQLMIPEIGAKGQLKIKEGRVFLAGLGGLGSASAYYLVAAGIGHLRIVDRDRVELGNLNRQILYSIDDIGRKKSSAALDKLTRLNPGCRIEAFHEEIRADNILELMGDCGLIVDGTDTLNTRKILNTASLQRGVPLFLGGVYGLNGMATTLVPGETACLECLFPGEELSRKQTAVLGPLPGLIASIQALEVVKYLLGMQGLLKGRLMRIQGAGFTIKTIAVDKNPNCRVCGRAGDQ
jgi:adenylyltransferase/sulfurtransferase